MARGRAVDLTLPPTRALTQQRDYRARKAAKIAQLENDNDKLREENEKLKDEIAGLKASQEANGLSIGDRQEQERRAGKLKQSLISALHQANQLYPTVQPHVSGSSSRAASPAVNQPIPQLHLQISSPQPSPQHTSNPGLTVPYNMANPQSPSSYSNSSASSSFSHAHSQSYYYNNLPSASSPQFVPSPILLEQEGPGRPAVQLDPNCCDGIFDCSSIPGYVPPQPALPRIQIPGPAVSDERMPLTPEHTKADEERWGLGIANGNGNGNSNGNGNGVKTDGQSAM